MLSHNDSVRSRVALDDNNQVIQMSGITSECILYDVDITLDDHHKLTQDLMKINVKECMESIMHNAYLTVARRDTFVKRYWNHIGKLVAADGIVYLTGSE